MTNPILPTITEANLPIPLARLTATITRFPEMSLPDKQAFVDELVDRHPVLNFEWANGWRYRRARTLNEQEFPATVDEVIWRKGAPANLGRANPAGFQVLYVADRQDTALSEARIEESRVAIADFEIRTEHVIRICPVGELLQVQRTGRGFMSGDSSPKISGLLNACSLEDARSLLITDGFLLDCVYGQDDYELSSHVVKRLFDKLPGVTAVGYPSRRQFGAINFAIRVETFWQDWGLRSVRHARARHLALGFYELDEVHHVEHVSAEGVFTWSKDPGPEHRSAMFRSLWTP